MFTEREIYNYCRERITWLPERPGDDHLHGVFAELSRNDIATLFDNIESGVDMLPRLLSALNPNRSAIDPASTLDSFIDSFRGVMDQFLEKPDCDRWNSLRVDNTVEEDDEDLLFTIYDTFGDWIVNGSPDSDHPVNMLREALYSIKADYMVMHYITWPLNGLREQVTINPLDPLFELSVRDYRLAFQGNRVRLIQS